MKNLFIFNFKNLTKKDSPKRNINKLNIKTQLHIENKTLKKSLIFSENFNINNYEHFIEKNKNRLEETKDFIKIFMNKIKLNKIKKENQPIKPLFHTNIIPFNLSKSNSSIHYNTNIKNNISNEYKILKINNYKKLYNKNLISLKKSTSQLTISNSDCKKFININDNKIKKKLNDIHYKNIKKLNYYSHNNINHSIYKLINDIEINHKHSLLKSFSTENITTQEPSSEINSYIFKPLSILKSKSNDKKYISNKYFMTRINRFIKNSNLENLDKTKEYLKYLNIHNYK